MIASYEAPGYGGASTAAYNMFEKMQLDELDVCFINLISNLDDDFFFFFFGHNYGNPKNLKNVHTFIVNEPKFQGKQLDSLFRLIEDEMPDIILGIGYISAYIMNRLKPDIPLIFLTVGFAPLKNQIGKKSFKDTISLLNSLSKQKVQITRNYHDQIEMLLKKSKLIITHSDVVKSLYEHIYPAYNSKIYSEVIWFVEWICEEVYDYQSLKLNFEERDIDLLFISSSWQRKEKNYPMVIAIGQKCLNLKIHIVGEEPMDKEFGFFYHGLISDRSKLFSLMGRAKVVVSPSLFDAAPGILFEAALMGCNIVTSKNCGNWQLCHSDLLVSPFNSNEFAKACQKAVESKYESNLADFINKNSYQKLLDLLEVI